MVKNCLVFDSGCGLNKVYWGFSNRAQGLHFLVSNMQQTMREARSRNSLRCWSFGARAAKPCALRVCSDVMFQGDLTHLLV